MHNAIDQRLLQKLEILHTVLNIIFSYSFKIIIFLLKW